MATWTSSLEPLEQNLLSCAASGRRFAPGGLAPTIRAEVLKHLLVETEWPMHAKGVEMRGVVIDGDLELESAAVRCAVWLSRCVLASVDLNLGTVPSLMLTGCTAVGLSAISLVVTKGVDLSKSTFTGPVNFVDASITGGLYCADTTLEGDEGNGYALLATRMSLSGGMHLRDFLSTGSVELVDAVITGSLDLTEAKFRGQSKGVALDATRLTVSGGADLTKVSTTSGALILDDASVTGALRLKQATLAGTNPYGEALRADGLKVSSGAYLEALEASGWLSLRDADITGQLSLRGSTITGARREPAGDGAGPEAEPGGICFAGDRLKASGGAWFSGTFNTDGAVRLSGADIGGMLSFAGAKLNGADELGGALIADTITVRGGVYIGWGFAAAGAVILRDANITSQLLIGQSLDRQGQQDGGEPPTPADVSLTGVDKDGFALVGTRLVVTGDALLQNFTSAGTIGLVNAKISGELRWAPGAPASWALDLSGASVGVLGDDGNWPKDGRLRLAGFAYTGFSADSQLPWRHRLEWIHGQYPPTPIPVQPADSAGRRTRFAAQPYEQLATVYEQTGQDDDAREIRIAALRDRRNYGWLPLRAKALNRIFDVTIRYGYKSWFALVYLLVLYLVAVAAFSFAQSRANVIVPSGDITGLKPVPTAARCSSNYTCFSPAGFALDVVVPIIDVHQADEWRVNANASWGWLWLALTWLGTMLGWAFATLFVAGFTGLVRQT